MSAFYNDNDPKICVWLKELIKRGHIPAGVVDGRSIADIHPDELRQFAQVHLFAGIGGWSAALEIAGWPERQPAFTLSAPCQPFSNPGHGLAEADPRHLWPYARNLIQAHKPAIVFGEQISSPLGRKWLGNVFDDLEALGYKTAGADLCASSIDAAQIRQRLYWGAANTDSIGVEGFRLQPATTEFARPWGPDSTKVMHALGPFHGRPGILEPVIAGKLNGIPAGLVRIRGYGNAIVPQLAAEFITSFMEALDALQGAPCPSEPI